MLLTAAAARGTGEQNNNPQKWDKSNTTKSAEENLDIIAKKLMRAPPSHPPH